MKYKMLIGVFIALLCGCNNNSTTNNDAKQSVKETDDTLSVSMSETDDTLSVSMPEMDEDSLKEETVELADSTTVRYLDALPAEYQEGDGFGLVLSYGGYGMDVGAWPMPDGDWLITWHWCAEEDDSGMFTRIDENGNEVPIVYTDPFEGQPYPVIHKPDLSFSTRNYGGETIRFYSAPDSDEVVCSTDFKEISLDVIAADLKTRRLLVRTNPNDWCWLKPGDEKKPSSDNTDLDSDYDEYRHPFVELRGWVDEEWVCGSTMTTCP